MVARTALLTALLGATLAVGLAAWGALAAQRRAREPVRWALLTALAGPLALGALSMLDRARFEFDETPRRLHLGRALALAVPAGWVHALTTLPASEGVFMTEWVTQSALTGALLELPAALPSPGPVLDRLRDTRLAKALDADPLARYLPDE